MMMVIQILEDGVDQDTFTGIEGVPSVVEEFFKENELPVIKSDIPTIKVDLPYSCNSNSKETAHS